MFYHIMSQTKIFYIFKLFSIMYASVVPKHKRFRLQPDRVMKDWEMMAEDCTTFKSAVAELGSCSQLKPSLKILR